MKFENFKQNKNEESSFDLGRRNFLKKSLLATGVMASYIYGIDKALSAFFEDEDEKEEKPDLKKGSSETVKNPEQNEAESIATEILRAYNSPAISRRFDPEVFTKDLFIAQQYQESRYNADTESRSGAKGVYQNKPESIMDVVKFLVRLRNSTKNSDEKYKCDYQGPEEISLKQAQAIGDLLMKHSDYGRAVGKLYLLAIHDKDSAFNQFPNRDVFRGRPANEQQDLLLLSYHDGPSIRYKPKQASNNGREYVFLVRKHMKNIDDIRRKLEKNGLSRDLDYAVIKIMREMERRENRSNQPAVIDNWVAKLKLAQSEKWKKEGKNKILTNAEIRNLFQP